MGLLLKPLIYSGATIAILAISLGSIPGSPGFVCRTFAAQNLDAVEMQGLIGGACAHEKCQNLCQTKEDCGTCIDGQAEGERCPGGGGGSGTAFVCISSDGDYDCEPGSDDSSCNPTKVCKCDAGQPLVCKEFNAGSTNGKNDCVTTRCASD